MDYSSFIFSIERELLTVTLNRPEALNALNTSFFNELNHLFDKYRAGKDFRAVIITGSGKAFAAGADIAEMVTKSREEAMRYSALGQETFTRIEMLDAPVIAAVNGYALGGGCELALACDIRIASEKAVFGQPETNLGLIPGFAATKRLPQAIGMQHAMYYLLTAENIPAAEAYRIHLVQKVVSPEDLMPAARELADKILSKGPAAIQLVKNVLRKGFYLKAEEAFLHERKAFSALFGNEGTEGLKAFMEKRKPDWTK